MIGPAKEIASRGIRVLPVHIRKYPLVHGGVNSASCDIPTVSNWWRRWPAANIAIACGHASGIWIVDVDPRNGGCDTLAEIEWEHGHLGCENVVITPSGGRHYVYRWPEGCPASTRFAAKLGTGIDILANGRYALAPPSVGANGHGYRWEIGGYMSLGQPPKWLVDLVRLASQPAESVAPRMGPVTGDVLERARRYVAAIPGAVSGAGGHSHTFLLAQKLVRGWGLDDRTALELLREWNAKCVPPWSDWELRRKIAQAVKHGHYARTITPR